MAISNSCAAAVSLTTKTDSLESMARAAASERMRPRKMTSSAASLCIAAFALLVAVVTSGAKAQITVNYQCNGSYQQDICNPNHAGSAAILNIGAKSGTVTLQPNGYTYEYVNTFIWDANFGTCPVSYTQHETSATDWRGFVLDGASASFQQSWTADMTYCYPNCSCSNCGCYYPSIDVQGADMEFDLGAKGRVSVHVYSFYGPSTSYYSGSVLASFYLHDVPQLPVCKLDFTAATTFSSGANPVSTALGDLNGDGKADIIAANSGGSDGAILLGNGNGTFGAATHFGTGGGNPNGVATGDFNGDGKLDFVVSNADGWVSTFFGNGDGTIVSGTHYYGVFPHAVAVGDFNGDGKLDMAVVSDAHAMTVGIFIGVGNGTFTGPLEYGSGSMTSAHLWVAAGDLNHDGKLDLAVANSNNTVSVLLGNGDGTFPAGVQYAVGNVPYTVAMADFNGDGHVDLAAANTEAGVPDGTSNTVSILIGNGDGTFLGATNYPSGGTGVTGLAVADFNADGFPDVAMVNHTSNTVSVLAGAGDGTLFRFFNVPTLGSSSYGITAGDVSGDGRPDVVVANYISSTLSVLREIPSNSPNCGQPPTGACCNPTSGVCSVVIRTDCGFTCNDGIHASFTYWTPGTLCNPNPCVGDVRLSTPTACNNAAQYAANGDLFRVTVDLANMLGSHRGAAGANLYLHYDTTKLLFDHATAGSGFTLGPILPADLGSGNLDVYVQAFDSTSGTALAGSSGLGTLVTLYFTSVADACGGSSLVTWRADAASGPPIKIKQISSSDGCNPGVPATWADLPSEYVIDHTPPAITCTAPPAHNADAGTCTYTYPSGTFPAPPTLDTCDGAIAPYFYSRTGGGSLTDPFHDGDTVTWAATDSCGNTVAAGNRCIQTVHVNPLNTASVVVSLSSVAPGSFTRCITFDFAGPAGCAAQTRTANVTFSSTDAAGNAAGTAVIADLPCGDGPFTSVTARDRFHTLRRTALTSVNSSVHPNTYAAAFSDASSSHTPHAPGNAALLGGNLNGDWYIDILDFGVFVNQFGLTPGASTPCNYAPLRNADINASGGPVDPLDYSYVSAYFLDANDPDGCGALHRDGDTSPGPTMDIGVFELAAMGEWEIARTADLNHDGHVSMADVALLGFIGTPLCPADFDASQIVGVDDLFVYLYAWFANYPAADFDDNHSVDIDDLFMFINAWFTGCP